MKIKEKIKQKLGGTGMGDTIKMNVGSMSQSVFQTVDFLKPEVVR